jgi:phage gp29-like protein
VKEIINFRERILLDDSQMSGYQELSVRRIKAILASGELSELTNLYRIMMTKDSHIASEIRRRKSRIRAQNMIAKSSNSKTQAALDVLFSTNEPKKLLDRMLSAIEYGFFAGQLYYDTKLHLNQIHQTRIYSDSNGFYFYDSKGTSYRLDDRFMAFTHFEQQVHEASALYSLIYLFTAKHFVLANYLKFAELLGVPPIIINATDSDSSAEIIKNTMDLKSGGIGVFAKDDTIKVLEGKGTQAEFMEFIKYCDSQISLVISGNTLTSNSDGKGSLALGKVHENSQNMVTQEDCYFFGDQLASFLKISLALEGYDTSDISVIFEFEKDTDLKARAETLAILAGMGVDIPIDYLATEFNLPSTTTKTTPVTSTKNDKNKNLPHKNSKGCDCCGTKTRHTNQRKTPQKEHNAITQSMYDQLDAMEQEALNDGDDLAVRALDFMVDALGSCASYQEAIELTTAAFGAQPLEGFTELMQNSIANNALAGMADVQLETGTKP